MNQHSLDFTPAQSHSPTSLEAAQAILPKAGTLRRKVLDYIAAQADGATDQEIQQALGMDPSTERPRRVELQRAGLVCDSGKTRRTASGRNAVVWILKRG